MSRRPFLALCVLVLGALAAGGCATRSAQRPLRMAPDEDPLANVPAHRLFLEGLGLAREGDFVRAEQYLVASIHRGADEGRVMPYLLQVCVSGSRFRAAVEYATPYLQRHPDDWQLRYLVGTILAGLGESRSARREFEGVLASHADDADAHYMLATLLRDSFNDPIGADGHFRRYLALAPEGPHVEEARQGLLRNVQP